MARRGSRFERESFQPFTSRRLLDPLFLSRPLSRVDLSLFEDRRRFTPDPLTTRNIFGQPHRLIVASQPNRNAVVGGRRRTSPALFSPPIRVGFDKPRLMPICERRMRRREVMFALKKTGKGARSRRRRNYFTDISC